MTILKQPFTRLLSLFFAAVVLAGCSSSPEKEKLSENLTEAQLYQLATEALNTSRYTTAIERFRTLESRYPFGSFAEQSQLDLVYAYYMNAEPEASRAAADRFLRLHPQHPDADYPYYMKGLASNTAAMGIVERFLPLDSTKRDPGQARQSFNEFRELLSRYPESKYAPDARQRMVALRNRLAAYEIHAANYYMKRKAYVAAVNRGKYVVEHMQKTPAVEPALGVMIEGYQHLGLTAPAEEALTVLKANFPESKLLGKNGEFIGYQAFGDVDPSLLYTLTFGLLGESGVEKQKTASAPKPPVSQ